MLGYLISGLVVLCIVAAFIYYFTAPIVYNKVYSEQDKAKSEVYDMLKIGHKE